MVFKNWVRVAHKQIDGGHLSRAEAREILATADDDVLSLVAAAGRIRRHHFQDTVKVNYLVNVKSGLCPEDCSYCSQRLGSTTEILTYAWLPTDQVVEQANAGVRAGASRVCLVASGRGPSNRDIERVASAVGRLKEEHPQLEVCACLGILADGQADRLQTVGVDAYNHNLNTSESRYGEICTTHDYQDRVDTIGRARLAGLSPCSGVIVGMGETDDELIDAIFALRDVGSESIPINFLMPFDGTPLQDVGELNPLRCLRILALARFACPATELRMAAGREMHLRSLQALALHVANSIFLGDYLTSEGQAAEADLAMIADAGFRVLSQEPTSPVGSCEPSPQVAVRARGAGTEFAPNA